MTRRVWCAVATVAATLAAAPAAAMADPASLVDTRDGSLGAGFPMVGASVPFGMIEPGPDTALPNGQQDPVNYCGYSWQDPDIRGFSLTHFDGAGIMIAGDLPFMPTTGAVSASDPDGIGWASPFSHTSEVAQPGYYAVTLARYQTRVELTGTTRAAMIRFRFPATTQANVLAEVSQSINGANPGSVTVVGNHELHGWVKSDVGYKLYFDAIFDRRFSATVPSASGPATEAAATFDTSVNPTVTMRVGISATFAHDFAAHETAAGTQTVDLNTFHPWEHGPGLRDANLRPQAQILKALGGEVLMLDDQWQGSSSGDWQWDTARFPLDSTGVPQFVDYLHSLGLALGLWMSPAEFNPSSATYKAHPQWACTPTGDVTAQIPDDAGLGVWNFTNARLRANLSQVIDRLVAQNGVREFKFDYVAWVDCPPHDYLDYEDAYAAWVHEQQVRHPGVTFELDETNDQRLWALRSAALGPSWFDNGHLQGSTYPARLLHDVWSAAPWVPPSALGFGTYDDSVLSTYSVDYLMPIALLGHVTFWDDLTTVSQPDRTETAWWLSWYEAHRAELGGVVYEDSTTDPIDGSSWAAFQPWDGDHGYVFAFRQAGSAASDAIPLQAVDPARRYDVTDVRTGAALGTFTQLRAGLTVTLPAPFSAAVLSVTPA